MSGTGKAPSDTVVICAGNRYRSDDGVGLVVAERLRERVGTTVTVLALEGEATEVMSGWVGCRLAIVVDAVYSGEPPGHVYRLDPTSGPLPRDLFRLSTHAFGVPEAIELGRALKTLPKRVLVFGIEGRNFNAGTELTPSVAVAVESVIERILVEIERTKVE